METSRTLLSAVIAGAFALMSATSASAQGYPTKNIHIVVAFAPGGGVDLSARTIAAKLREALGQPVIVENRPGAGGQIAVEAVIRAQPDGYTFLTTSNSPIVIGPHLKTLGYDPVTDLTPVAILAWGMLGIAVNPSSPFKTVQDLIASAKQTAGGISYSNPGIGTQMHLAGELLKSFTGANLIAIPYKGAGPAAAAVISGEVSVAISDLTSLLAHAEAGRLRLLAMANSRRSTQAPQIPTVAESGVPGYGADAWTGIFAPAQTPRAILDRVNADIRRALAVPEIRDNMLKAGLEPVALDPDASRELVISDSKKWQSVIKSANIKIE